MTEVSDARAHQRHRGGVAQGVRGDVLGRDRRAVARGGRGSRRRGSRPGARCGSPCCRAVGVEVERADDDGVEVVDREAAASPGTANREHIGEPSGQCSYAG
jgi:hypothetical protein